jgi:hypothetical protein
VQTQQQYRKLLADQSRLDGFLIKVAAVTTPPWAQEMNVGTGTMAATAHESEQESTDATGPMAQAELDPEHAIVSDPEPAHGCGPEPDDFDVEDQEAWEDEVTEDICGQDEVRGWDELRAQINKELEKKHKSLSLAQINQLMLIQSFATLCLKGLKRIPASLEITQQWHKKDGQYFAHRIRALARHYQIFEHLSDENRGGKRVRNHSCLTRMYNVPLVVGSLHNPPVKSLLVASAMR